jgi:hypothetical protein
MADEALAESRFIIQRCDEWPERLQRLSGKVYRQSEQARAALGRLEVTLRALNARFTGGRHSCK